MGCSCNQTPCGCANEPVHSSPYHPIPVPDPCHPGATLHPLVGRLRALLGDCAGDNAELSLALESAEPFRVQGRGIQGRNMGNQSVLYAAAHLLTLPAIAQTEMAGRVTEAMEGEVKRGTAYGDRFQGWNLTVWGQQYLALRQQRAKVSFVVA